MDRVVSFIVTVRCNVESAAWFCDPTVSVGVGVDSDGVFEMRIALPRSVWICVEARFNAQSAYQHRRKHANIDGSMQP